MPHICPWCQTEIVWDPELGPEEDCPNCLNPLGDYKTVEFTLDQDKKNHTKEFDKSEADTIGFSRDVTDHDDLSPHHHAPNRHAGDEDDEEDVDFDLDEDWDDEEEDIPGEMEAWGEWEAAVEKHLDTQDEFVKCSQCQEDMVLTGFHRMNDSNFSANSALASEAFLPAPFTVKVFLCPTCFQVQYSLSEEDRLTLLKRYKEE